MTARNLLNVFLAIVLIGLIVLAVYEPGKQQQSEPAKLTTLNSASIKKIVIEQPSQEKIILQKINQQWQMLEPFAISANNGKIDNLLEITDATSHAQYPFSEIDSDQLGLTTPQLRLYLNATILNFGTTSALGGHRYIRIDDTVHLITDRFRHLIGNQPTALINTQLIPDNSQLTQLQLPDFTLSKENEGWRFVPKQQAKQYGKQPPGSQDAIQQLIDEWRLARAIKISPSTNRQALASQSPTQETIVITLAGREKPVHFNLIHGDDGFIFQRPDLGLDFHLTTETGKRLLTLPPKAKPSSNSATDTD